ncbi:MAG: hypothetical protein M1602_04385, partial [Firmicutes bacterium]|nr:hypothetical protein [Bacillota bacterium]
RMPQTALLFLGGAVAIAALPPSNGFLSEVLTLKALLSLGASAPAAPARLVALLAAAGLAFTGALAAAAFVKAFGISFLGLPRSQHATSAQEAPLGMRLGMWLLLALCVVIGLAPGPALGVVQSVGGSIAAGLPASGFGPAGASFNISAAATVSSVTQGLNSLTSGLALSLLAAGLLAFWLAWAWSKGRPIRVAEPWACGVGLQPEMQYSGAALVKPLRLFFRTLLRPERAVSREDTGSRYFPTVIRYEASLTPVYERYLYLPFQRALLFASTRLKRIQTGSVQAYLAYIVATLALLLILAR